MFWGIIGVVISLLGIFISYLGLKEKTLRFWQIESESLFSDKVKNIEGFSIKYKNEEVDKDIIVITTVIENNGRKDIDRNIIFDPLKIVFSEPIDLLDATIIKNTGNANIEIIDNSVICNWDLLKKKEFIVVKFVLKNTSDKSIKINSLLKSYTKISTRITDLNKTKKKVYTESLSSSYNKSNLLLYSISSFILISCVTFTLFYKTFSVKYNSQFWGNENFSIYAKDTNNFKLKSNNRNEIIKISDFNDKVKDNDIIFISEENTNSFSTKLSVSLFFFVIILYILMFLKELDSYFTYKKVMSFFPEYKIKKEEKEKNNN